MNKKELEERRQIKNADIRKLVSKAKTVCSSFSPNKYQYNAKKAIHELGLDEELVNQLLEDYVTQIINVVLQFEEMLYTLQANKDSNNQLDYTELRNLAHKNLGVARNLRIEDASILLDELMNKDDLEYLFVCIETLRACAIKLKPEHAYKTIKLIEVKSTF